MKKLQLYTRLVPDVVELIIRRFNEREMSLLDAVDAFQHRIVVVLKAEAVDNEVRANLVAREHFC